MSVVRPRCFTFYHFIFAERQRSIASRPDRRSAQRESMCFFPPVIKPFFRVRILSYIWYYAVGPGPARGAKHTRDTAARHSTRATSPARSGPPHSGARRGGRYVLRGRHIRADAQTPWTSVGGRRRSSAVAGQAGYQGGPRHAPSLRPPACATCDFRATFPHGGAARHIFGFVCNTCVLSQKLDVPPLSWLVILATLPAVAVTVEGSEGCIKGFLVKVSLSAASAAMTSCSASAQKVCCQHLLENGPIQRGHAAASAPPGRAPLPRPCASRDH